MAHVSTPAILLVLSIFVSSINTKCTIDSARYPFSRAIYEFTTEITGRIAEQTNAHFVASPLSLWSLLSAVSEGATGATLNEIQQALHHHHHKCYNWKYYELLKQITSEQPSTLLEKSGLIVIDENLNPNRKFINKLNKMGIADMLDVDCNNAEDAAFKINEYVKTVTHGSIKEIIGAEDVTEKILILLDAIRFKGKWKQPFDSVETEPAPFYDEQNQEIGKVNLMFNSDNYNLISVEQIKARVLELPYGDDNRFSMLIFLPFEGELLQNVLDKLQDITIKSLFTVFANKGPRKLQIMIPRFKITSEIGNLKELLNDMGINSMFDETQASFSEICDFIISVSDVLQIADIEVTEEGTTAVAVSAAEFEDRMMPETFNANKPFAFMIFDKVINVVMFTGAYSKPSLF